jgi:hypothetical protein
MVAYYSAVAEVWWRLSGPVLLKCGVKGAGLMFSEAFREVTRG